MSDHLAVLTDHELERLLEGAKEKDRFLREQYQEIMEENMTRKYRSERVMAKLEELRIKIDYAHAYIRAIEKEEQRRFALRRH